MPRVLKSAGTDVFSFRQHAFSQPRLAFAVASLDATMPATITRRPDEKIRAEHDLLEWIGWTDDMLERFQRWRNLRDKGADFAECSVFHEPETEYRGSALDDTALT
jgi:hypothetical protein